jgi:hypothetical protein
LARWLAFLLPILLLAGCAPSCANRIVSRLDAPDGAQSAVLFQRDCGATTGFSTQISVLPAGGQPEDSGNVLRADGGHDAAVRAGAWGGPWAEMHWLSPRHLLVRYATGARLFGRQAQVTGITISYEPVSR